MSEQGYNWRALGKLLILGLLTVLGVAFGIFEAVDIVFLAVIELTVLTLFALVAYFLGKWWFLRLLSLPWAIMCATMPILMGWAVMFTLFAPRPEREGDTQEISIDVGLATPFELVPPATKVLAVVVVAGMVIQFVMALRFGVEERLSDRVGGIFFQLGVRFAAFFFTISLMAAFFLLRTPTGAPSDVVLIPGVPYDVVLIAAFAVARIMAELGIQSLEQEFQPEERPPPPVHRSDRAGRGQA